MEGEKRHGRHGVTTAFVLPGGATLGAVQVGMLQALDDAGIRPDVVLGSSVGALNGALIAFEPGAAGLSRLESLWLSVRRHDVFPVSPGLALGAIFGRQSHVVNPSRLRRLIARHVGDARIEEATIPLHLLATDLRTGDPVVLSAGPLVDATMASTAMPGIFPPVPIDGRLLVDGSVADDTPVATALKLGAGVIYVLPTFGGLIEGAVPRKVSDMLLHATGLMLSNAGDIELRYCAAACPIYVLPAPEVPNISPFDFGYTAQLIEQARNLARAWLRQPQPARSTPAP
jgi:NTE family protein